RRRHTRFSRDWSSDVCSSDLQSLGETFLSVIISAGTALILANVLLPFLDKIADVPAAISLLQPVILGFMVLLILVLTVLSGFYRSEERRVGKECRSGCGQYN